MDFEQYLQEKKIDSAAFKSSDAALWEEFRIQFEQMHPKSFTAQKLFLINDIRRKYLLEIVKETEQLAKAEESKPKRPVVKTGKPVMAKPKIPNSSEPKKAARPVMKRPKMK